MAARERLIQVYLSALGAASIYILATNAGVKIARGRDGGEIICIAWCDPRAVDIIVDNAREGGAFANTDDAERRLALAAETLGVELRTDADMDAVAGLAVDRVEGEFTRALKAGELRALNSRYRDYRLGQNAAGKPALSYSRFMWNERVSLVKKTADLVAGSSRMSAKLKAAIEQRPQPTVAAE